MSEAALARVHSVGGWQQYGEAWIRFIQCLNPSAVAQ